MSQSATIYETSAEDKIGHFFTLDLAEKKMLTAVIKCKDVQTIKKMMNSMKNILTSSESLQNFVFFFLLH
jgi:hypothetical protein